jgi:uncharacterized damage-inducible protein DinB
VPVVDLIKKHNAMKILTETTTATGLASLINDYVHANRWATQTIVEWLRTKPADLIGKEIPSSFPGIRESLVHIWDTERFWLSVIKQEPAPVSFRMQAFEGTLEEVFEGIQETSRQLVEYVTSLSDDELCEAVNLDTPWVAGTKTRYEFIHHAMNHSSYHRGQVVTIGHHVGFHDAPMTDFSFYLFNVKGY